MGNLKEGAVIYRKMVKNNIKTKNFDLNRAILTNFFLVLIVMVMSVSMVSSATWTSNLNDNLLAWWNFDNLEGGNLTDNYNGNYDFEREAVSGSPFEVTGIIGDARRFNNTGNYNYSHHNIEELNRNFTFSIWANLSNNRSSPNPAIFTTGINGWSLNHDLNDINLYHTGLSVLGTCDMVNNVNLWTHYGLVVQSNNTFRLFINGTECSSGDIGAVDFSDGTGLQQGFGSEGGIINMSLDEAGLWNRTLNATEMLELYNSGLGLTFTQDVNLITPPNNNITLSGNIIFTVNSSSTGNMINTTLYVWNASNQKLTNFSTITGTYNLTTLSLKLGSGSYTWNQYSCSDLVECKWSLSNRTLIVKSIIENSENYNTNVQETSNQSFQINITYNSITYPSITANLIYNNTAYTGTKIGSGNTILFNTSIIATDITTPSNIPFYWTFGLNDGSTITYINSTFHNQTVSTISVINITTGVCSAGWFESANYTFKDSENLTTLTNITVKYNFKYGVGGVDSEELYGEFNHTNVVRICINNTVNTYSIGYGELDYQQSGYVERRYYMFDGHSLSNSTGESFVLYDLPTADSTSFIFEIKNTFLNPYTDKYIGLLRWYPALNEYKTVEMALTDNEGKTVIKTHTEDVDYRVGVYEKDGTLIKLADPVRMACLVNPCTYTLRIISDEEDYTEIYNIETNLIFDNSLNRFVFTWNDPSQNTITMRLLVTKDLGFQETVFCNVTGSGNTGVLICDIGNNTGTFKAIAYRSASPELALISILKEIRSRLNNSLGLFISFVVMLVVGLIGIFSPTGAIIMFVIGAIPAYLFGSINLVILGAIAVLGGLIIHIIKRT